MSRDPDSEAEIQLVSADNSCVWHPYTRHAVEDPPLAVVAAAGARLRLADGRELVDGISSWWASVHGHAHPALIDAMVQQARTLDHVLFAGATHPAAVTLAQRLLSLAPAGLSRVFFSDDGSTAVEVALKMAVHAFALRGQPQRRTFIALTNAYHGDTFGAMAVGDPVPYFLPFGPLLCEVHRVPPQADELARALRTLGPQVAAVIVEPLLQAAGGMLMHPPGFLQSARALCDEAGVFLIADEVATGFGRTGAVFACDKAELRPDFLCLAKGLTAGMATLAVTLTTEGVYRTFTHAGASTYFPHGHTMTANPIACAVACASLDLLEREEVPARLDRLGQRIFDGVADLVDAPHVKDIRRLGGVVAIELHPAADDVAGYDARRSTRLRRLAIDMGVLLRPLGDVLYAWPPACTSDEECDAIILALRAQVQAA